MKRIIVFVADFPDVAYNEMRGVIISELQKMKSSVEVILEPVAPIREFSIINGNFVLRLLAEVYPKGTIFSALTNPLKERPARLIGKTKKKGFYFMGANTGIFDWFFRDFGIEELYELHDPGFVPFGAKYVHAPALAQIATGRPLREMGAPFDVEKVLELNIADGTIVHIDNFGLMKFTGVLPHMNEDDKAIVQIKNHSLPVVYAKRMMSRDTGEWVLYPGSSLGLPELGKVRQDGAREIDAEIGDIIKVVL